jgi:hypothetical protein
MASAGIGPAVSSGEESIGGLCQLNKLGSMFGESLNLSRRRIRRRRIAHESLKWRRRRVSSSLLRHPAAESAEEATEEISAQ